MVKSKTYSLLMAFAALVAVAFTSCNSGLPLEHTADCKFKTPEALAQSVALCLRDRDFTCADHYLPGMASVFGMESTNESDSAVANFGTKAEHLLVKAFKEEIIGLRTKITAKGGDIAKLKLVKVAQSEDEGITHITMHLSAGSVDFTAEPVGLFNSEGSWYLLGARFTTTLE